MPHQGGVRVASPPPKYSLNQAGLRVPHQGGVSRGDDHGALKSNLVLRCLNAPRARVCAAGPPWQPEQARALSILTSLWPNVRALPKTMHGEM